MTQKERRQRQIELAVFWTSLALVVGLIGWLVAVEIAAKPTEPRIVASVDRLTSGAESSTVRYRIENKGAIAVSDVVLTVALGDEEVQHRISHLSEGMISEGVAVFYNPPSTGTPSARVKGYQLP